MRSRKESVPSFGRHPIALTRISRSNSIRSTGWPNSVSMLVAEKCSWLAGGTDALSTFTPIPRTKAFSSSPIQVVSTRIPATLRFLSNTSLGHLICGLSPSLRRESVRESASKPCRPGRISALAARWAQDQAHCQCRLRGCEPFAVHAPAAFGLFVSDNQGKIRCAFRSPDERIIVRGIGRVEIPKSPQVKG